MRRLVLLTVVLAVGTAVVANAACVPQASGPACFTADPSHANCQRKLGKAAAKMAQRTIKCHRKQADQAFRGVPFDEEACEAAAIQPFLAIDATGCPCVVPSNLATLWETVLDGANQLIYCGTGGGGTPFGDDDAGRVPATAGEAKCQGKIAACVAKLVIASEKCHASAAKAAVSGVPFDEDACLEGPILGKPGAAARERYATCVTRATAAGGCDGCESPSGVAHVVDAVLNGRSDLVYCMDRPGSGACPTEYDFMSVQPGDMDVGWTGSAHDQRFVPGTRLTLGVSGCANGSPPCGTCGVSGPIPNAPGAAFPNHRCRGDGSGANGSWVACTSDADCPGDGNACVYFLGPPQPVSAGGIGVCTLNEIVGPISGTLDPSSGAASFGIAIDRVIALGSPPCPRCVAGFCDVGVRAGKACTTHGAGTGAFDDVSLDCPPAYTIDLGSLGSIATTLATGTQSVAITAATPQCSGPASASKCMCDVCDNGGFTPCFTDTDCVAVGATTCGGLRCVGGSNHGAACSNATECPFGSCVHPGGFNFPNACYDGVCTPNTPPDGDSVDEGLCLNGPFDQFCDIERFRGCSTPADCPHPGDSCSFGKIRECFTDDGTIGGTDSVAGTASPTAPAFGGFFCAPLTASSTVNETVGRPGLGRITISGIATMR